MAKKVRRRTTRGASASNQSLRLYTLVLAMLFVITILLVRYIMIQTGSDTALGY